MKNIILIFSMLFFYGVQGQLRTISGVIFNETADKSNKRVLQALQNSVPFTTIGAAHKPPVVLRCGVSAQQSDPLYVIDGEIATAKDFRGLCAEDIESISILKDAGATAIYGSRGRYGVIIITTKGYIRYDKYVAGLVTDKSGKPLSNILVQVEHWPNCALTDLNGRFTIGINKNQKLVVADFNYKSITVNPDRLGSRNIILEKENGNF